MKLLLSILLFLAAVSDSYARVSDDFHNCMNFFYKGRSPSGFEDIAKASLFDNNLPDGIKQTPEDVSSPAYICQTYKGKPYYATLYDRGRLMPLYSAYIMNANHSQPPTGCRRPGAFKLEPELVYRGISENMMLKKDAKQKLHQYNNSSHILEREPKNQPAKLLETSQADEKDYVTGYDKGHLNPCGHQSGQTDGYEATFTLTNVVPMASQLNQVAWSQYEKVMLTERPPNCTHLYVITGIVPGNKPIPGSRLPRPTHVWNAYCCEDNNGKPTWSGAGLAKNTAGSTVTKFRSIGEFQSILKGLLPVNNEIKLFDGDCKRQGV